jgi:hypothetical protein
VHMVLLGTLYPLGSITQGALADHFGLRAVTVGAAVVLASAGCGIRVLRPGFDRPVEDTMAPGAPSDVGSRPAKCSDAEGHEPEHAGHLGEPPRADRVMARGRAGDGTRSGEPRGSERCVQPEAPLHDETDGHHAEQQERDRAEDGTDQRQSV